MNCPRCNSGWNTSQGFLFKRYIGCFACLYQWWNLKKESK